MYCLRYRFGTRMAPKCDVFTLARSMGRSSITITQRYCHPDGRHRSGPLRMLAAPLA